MATTVTVTTNWRKCMDALATRLSAQRIDAIGTNVTVQSEPFDAGTMVRPGCYVTPAGRITKPYSTSREKVGYGCLVTVVRGSTPSRAGAPDRVTGWQELVARLCAGKRLTEATTLPDTDSLLPMEVEGVTRRDENPADDASLKALGHPAEGTSVLVRVWLAESRT